MTVIQMVVSTQMANCTHSELTHLQIRKLLLNLGPLLTELLNVLLQLLLSALLALLVHPFVNGFVDCISFFVVLVIGVLAAETPSIP